MATFGQYVTIADEVYDQLGQNPPTIGIGEWTTQKWERATWYGDGFQGGVFMNDDEIIVAFSGTKGGPTTAPISQNTANIRIGVNVIPNMAGSAFAMVNWAKTQANGRPVSIVGHSLGGGLAQVVGNWSGCPFISFNGPGMKRHLKMSAFNLFKPKQMLRSICSANTDNTIGICFYVTNDFVGTFGVPIGLAVDLGRYQDSHSLISIGTAIGLKGWRDWTPHQLYNSWPQ
jgi:putative lipase involved disintegration of autophagic bodies